MMTKLKKTEMIKLKRTKSKKQSQISKLSLKIKFNFNLRPLFVVLKLIRNRTLIIQKRQILVFMVKKVPINKTLKPRQFFLFALDEFLQL